MSIISVQNLTKRYEFHTKREGLNEAFRLFLFPKKKFATAVDDVSFTISEGSIVGLLGPNGAGKTSLIKMLSGILYPSGGKASVLGYTPWERKNAFKKNIAVVMGNKNQLWWDLPAVDTLALNRAIYEIPTRDYEKKLDELASLLDMNDFLQVPVRKLSLGQRMKAELIAALIHDPKVLFLDEPTLGLDVNAQSAIREFLLDYNKKFRITILLTSHYMEDVSALCEDVMVMNRGKIIYNGDFKELLKKYSRHKVLEITFTEKVLKKNLSRFGEIHFYSPKHAVLHVTLDTVKQKASEIMMRLPVDDILINDEPVEEIVGRIYRDGSVAA
ncbi:MAG: ATP-binding cassette domain-containing protein [Parcubacteria group bacterium]|nr:ATP-binding cassette domain-containing protein [Parcubacteria group bacterium]